MTEGPTLLPRRPEPIPSPRGSAEEDRHHGRGLLRAYLAARRQRADKRRRRRPGHDDGCPTSSERPGLGVNLDEEFLDAGAIMEPIGRRRRKGRLKWAGLTTARENTGSEGATGKDLTARGGGVSLDARGYMGRNSVLARIG